MKPRENFNLKEGTVHTMYMDTMNDDDMQCSCMDAFLSLLSLSI